MAAEEFDITIRGLDETCAALSKMPVTLVKQAFGKALAASAVPMIEALEPRVPMDTGLTKESIMTDIAIDSGGKGGQAQVGFGRRGFVARMIEFGHREVGPAPELVYNGKFKEGKPFMRIAAASAADKTIEAFAESLKASLDTGTVTGAVSSEVGGI